MANFGYDDDVLLKWEITGTGRYVGSYSHFNSMMRAEQMLKKATMIGNRFYGANNSQVKISGNAGAMGGKVGVLRNETLTRGVLKLVR